MAALEVNDGLHEEVPLLKVPVGRLA